MIAMVWDLMLQDRSERIISVQQFPVLYGTGWSPRLKTWITQELDDIRTPKDTPHDLQAVVLDREYLEGHATWLHSARDT